MGLRTYLRSTVKGLARAVLGPQIRMFDAARFSRLNSDFIGSSGSADAEIKTSIIALRNRARKLLRDNPYARQYRRTLQINIIGPRGIQLRGSVNKLNSDELDERRNKLLEASYSKWCRKNTCDVAGKLSFHGFETMIVGAMPDTGEALIRIVRQPFGGGKVPLALELIEADQLDEYYTGISDRPGRRWRLGVELDEWNRPTRYAILTRHPGDIELTANQKEQQKHIFLDAKDVIHIYQQDRVGATRGIPWLNTGIMTADALERYEKAHWTRKTLQSSLLGWIQSPEGEFDGDDVVNDQRVINTEPGSWNILAPGQQAIPPDFGPDDGQYDNVVRNLLRRFSAGTGTSYATISRDFSESNYSSSRLSTLEDRDGYTMEQSSLVQVFHQRVFEEFLEAAILCGELPVATFGDYWMRPERYNEPLWQARTWDWVDPAKELDAIRTKRELLIESHGDQVRNVTGMEFVETMARIKRENEIKEEMGLPLAIAVGSGSASVASEEGTNANANTNGQSEKPGAG